MSFMLDLLESATTEPLEEPTICFTINDIECCVTSYTLYCHNSWGLGSWYMRSCRIIISSFNPLYRKKPYKNKPNYHCLPRQVRGGVLLPGVPPGRSVAPAHGVAGAADPGEGPLGSALIPWSEFLLEHTPGSCGALACYCVFLRTGLEIYIYIYAHMYTYMYIYIYM